jgi:hypothetical protein
MLKVMKWRHISDLDLERWYLGMVSGETEIVQIEEHVLACAACAARAESSDEFTDSIRQAIILGDYDLALQHTGAQAED